MKAAVRACRLLTAMEKAAKDDATAVILGDMGMIFVSVADAMEQIRLRQPGILVAWRTNQRAR
jgi:hypothetical protein